MRAQLDGSSWTETCITLSKAMDSCLQQVNHQRLDNDLACLAADATSQTSLMTDKAAKVMHHLLSCKASPSATVRRLQYPCTCTRTCLTLLFMHINWACSYDYRLGAQAQSTLCFAGRD